MKPLVLFLALAAGASSSEPAVLRVGHFPNLTHAQALVAHGLSRGGKGWFEERLGPEVRIEWLVYNAGPSAMEALFAGALDLAYVGPNPAINAHLRSGGDEVRIVAGACGGGAALVVQPDGRIRADADFKGKRIATPQLGNTQDVAARAWLASRGLRVTLAGGDASVIPMANPDQLALFQRGELDAVWTVEPWVTRLELEAKGKVYMEESALWKRTGGRYVTTHLVARARLLEEPPRLIERFVAAHVELTRWIKDNPARAKELLNLELAAETTRALPQAVLDGAWRRIELTYDPLRASLVEAAEAAHRVGFLRTRPELSRIYALGPLNAALKAKGLPELR